MHDPKQQLYPAISTARAWEACTTAYDTPYQAGGIRGSAHFAGSTELYLRRLEMEPSSTARAQMMSVTTVKPASMMPVEASHPPVVIPVGAASG